MKGSKFKSIAFVATIMMAFGGLASAQTASEDYAISEQVTGFDTVSSEVALEFTNISDDTIDVELLNDGEIVATKDSVTVDSTGLADFDIGSNETVDQVRLQTYTASPGDVDSVTFYYDYTGTATDDTTNYASNQVFNSWEVKSGSLVLLGTIVPLVIVLAILGMAMDL